MHKFFLIDENQDVTNRLDFPLFTFFNNVLIYEKNNDFCP